MVLMNDNYAIKNRVTVLIFAPGVVFSQPEFCYFKQKYIGNDKSIMLVGHIGYYTYFK